MAGRATASRDRERRRGSTTPRSRCAKGEHPLRGRLATAAERASRARMRGCSADRAWLPGLPCPTLRILRARHPADRGVDVRAFGLQLIDVEAAPRNPGVSHARDEAATLLERGAIRLGSGPADLEEDRVAVRGRPKDLGTE